jgi:hypothetical protein
MKETDWDPEISNIASRYLQGKYTACDNEEGGCRALCDRTEITAILTEILPPVSPAELKSEVSEVLKAFGNSDFIEMNSFVEILKANTFWYAAGELVVKELIYLDALHSNYVSKKTVLSDDDFDALKDSLTWEVR